MNTQDINPFDKLDAQSIESRLAQVTSEELNPLDCINIRNMLLDDACANTATQADIDNITANAWLYSQGY